MRELPMGNYIIPDTNHLPPDGVYWKLHVHSLDLEKVFPLWNEEQLQNEEESKIFRIHCKNRIERILTNSHPDKVPFYGREIESRDKRLVTKILGYNSFHVNGDVQRAVHELIRSRSFDYLFYWVANEERMDKQFIAIYYQLEHLRDFDVWHGPKLPLT